MKANRILGLMVFLLLIISCQKDNTSLEYPYSAIVEGINSDCGIYQIKITQGLSEVQLITGSSAKDSVFIAENLPDELKVNGLKILLDLRAPKNEELGACTHLGISYPWIHVKNAIKE